MALVLPYNISSKSLIIVIHLSLLFISTYVVTLFCHVFEMYIIVFPILVDVHYFCNLSIFWRQNVCGLFSVPSVNFCHSSRCFFLLRHTMLIQSCITFSYLFVSKVQFCLKPPAQTSRYQSSGTCSMKLANRALAILLDQSRSSEGARHDRGSQSELGAWLVT